MSLRAMWVALAVLVAGGFAVFLLLEERVLKVFAAPSAPAEVSAVLESYREDLKQHASLDPVRASELRGRYDEVTVLARRLQVLELNRQAIGQRQRLVVRTAVALTLLLAGVAVAVRRGRDAARLGRLEGALGELAAGHTDIEAEVQGRDAIAAVARTVERLSRVVARDRQRLASLQNLSAWQEAARRQAHELRAPLAAAGLELDRVERAVNTGDFARGEEAVSAVRGELERLRVFAHSFTAFARLPQPDLASEDLLEIARSFCDTFAAAWPGVQIELVEPAGACPVRADRAMIRQVLQNLGDNAARAMGDRGGTVRLVPGVRKGGWVTLEVVDDGPGIAETVRARLFSPYVTTARPGEGMGLGLAISRKILLDHGGDLELGCAAPGASFVLRLPAGSES